MMSNRIRTGRESGMSLVKLLMLLVVALVLGVGGLKVAAAYLDIDGISRDLQALARDGDLRTHCVADPRCESALIDQIEQTREFRGRDVVLDFTSMEYFASENRFEIRGEKTVDLLVHRFVWPFTVSVSSHGL
jgi:hypothetical protein